MSIMMSVKQTAPMSREAIDRAWSQRGIIRALGRFLP
jgi:hypothetical protein